ncbi:hypothetical protein [Limnobacter alexandrii]|uniref:hypothetical protein n=1 Tax=Limnobacter alexandrii TaxID=2570352 RepID=UPI001109ECB7|nr:hypothetical protein [Limnobacter alexandrii]
MRIATFEKTRLFKSWSIEPMVWSNKKSLVMGAEMSSIARAYYAGLVQIKNPELAAVVASCPSTKNALKISSAFCDEQKIAPDSRVLECCLLAAIRDGALELSELEDAVNEIDKKSHGSHSTILGMHFAAVRDCLVRVINGFSPGNGVLILGNSKFDVQHLVNASKQLNFNEIGFVHVLSKDFHAQDITNWALSRRIVCCYHHGNGERILNAELRSASENTQAVIVFGEPKTDRMKSFVDEVATTQRVGVVSRNHFDWYELKKKRQAPRLVKSLMSDSKQIGCELQNGELF